MKVVILGGYGVFGGRLARLLLRDGHTVGVAGRNHDQALRFTRQYGGQPLRLDRNGDLQPLLDVAPDAVVDAVGPFQTYDKDSALRVAAFCVEHAINYLDLSDDGSFTTSISQLDEQAQAAGCFAISGASSVPGISSSVVAALSTDLSSIDVIDAAIVPGNRAPRGRSIVAAILSQVGAPLRVWRGGRWREMRCWSDRRVHTLTSSIHRSAYVIGVPDLTLFPEFFSARSVLFRAGLELSVMNVSLGVLGRLRAHGFFRANRFTTSLAYYLSVALQPFGTDEGGMVVMVIGEKDGQTTVRRWQLVAEAGEGPFIPAVIARALLRRADRIAPGARACLAEVSLPEIEEAMSDINVETGISEQQDITLFQSALAERWHDLSPIARRTHCVRDLETFSGRASVERGTGLLARATAWFFGFPDAGIDISLTVTKTRMDDGETWERNFGGTVFRSHLTPSRLHHVRERFWAFTYELELPVVDGAMHLLVRRGWFLGIPMPKFLLPGSDSREYVEDGKFRFDVSLNAPFGGGLIVRYRGTVSPDE